MSQKGLCVWCGVLRTECLRFEGNSGTESLCLLQNSGLMHNHNPPWSWIWADVDNCLVGLTEFGCLMRCCGRLPEFTNYLIWLNSCCFVRFCSRNWSKCVFVCDSSRRWVSGAEFRSKHPPLMSLQANSSSRGTPCLMHYMQAHNCKLHCNDRSAFARHRCQSKYFWSTEAGVGYWFSVICRNKHFNQSILESDFFPLWPVRDSDRKEIMEKVKQATFFSCLENKEWKSRKGVEEAEWTEKVLRSQRMRNFKTWKLKTIAATTCSRRQGKKTILRNKGGLCRGRAC